MRRSISPGGRQSTRIEIVASASGNSICRPYLMAGWNWARSVHPSLLVITNTRANLMFLGSTPMERLVVERTPPYSSHAVAGSLRSSSFERSFVPPWYGFTGTLHSSVRNLYTIVSLSTVPQLTANRALLSACQARAADRSSRKNALVPPPAFGNAYRIRAFRLRWAGGGADRLAWRTERSGAMSLRKH
eukprot:3636544-Prymnesium_polylepis.2